MRIITLCFTILLCCCHSNKSQYRAKKLSGSSWQGVDNSCNISFTKFNKYDFVAFDCEHDTILWRNFYIKNDTITIMVNRQPIYKSKILKMTTDSLILSLYTPTLLNKFSSGTGR